MRRVQNIFYGVVTSENSMTELLCNFMAYKPFRNAFIRLFFEDESEIISFDDFQTQYTTDINHSRPDIAIINDDCEFLLELKTWDTGLTDNQPSSYLEYLKSVNKQYKYLVFLVPSTYKYLAEWEKRVDSWVKVNKCKIPIKTIFWDEIISIIKHNDLDLVSERFRDFYELLKSWFYIEPITFSRAEVRYMNNPEIPNILTRLYAIADEVKNHFSQIYLVSKKMNCEEYGIYIKRRTDKEKLLFFGTWYPFWEEYECPLCFGVEIDDQNKDVIKKFTEHNKSKTIDYEGFRIVCIDKDILQDEGCSEKIIDMIKNELEIIS